MTTTTPVLIVDDVTVRFGGVTAVNGVSLTVERGERWAVIGPNGAGKTTLFKTISGEVRPTTGRVHLFGADSSKSAPYRKAQSGLGRTYQVTELFKELTVENNLAIAAQARSASRYLPLRPTRTNLRPLAAGAWRNLCEGWPHASQTVRPTSSGSRAARIVSTSGSSGTTPLSHHRRSPTIDVPRPLTPRHRSLSVTGQFGP